MGELRIGDIVARKSYGFDILFKITDIKKVGNENIVVLKGISYRIEADAPEGDLMVQPEQKVSEHNIAMSRMMDRKCRSMEAFNSSSRSKKALFRNTSKEKTEKFFRPGKILHIDGDNDYLNTCLEQYRKLDMEAVGVHIPEKEQAVSIRKLLQEHKPDILVLTGHDGMLKGDTKYLSLENYRNSKYFIDAVKEARKYDGNLDSLVIFAGACQSLYKGILEAGANFASAPYRVLIHALDPVLVCRKIAFTSIDETVDPREVIEATITGYEGIGGIQTRGKYRGGYPLEPYK